MQNFTPCSPEPGMTLLSPSLQASRGSWLPLVISDSKHYLPKIIKGIWIWFTASPPPELNFNHASATRVSISAWIPWLSQKKTLLLLLGNNINKLFISLKHNQSKWDCAAVSGPRLVLLPSLQEVIVRFCIGSGTCIELYFIFKNEPQMYSLWMYVLWVWCVFFSSSRIRSALWWRIQSHKQMHLHNSHLWHVNTQEHTANTRPLSPDTTGGRCFYLATCQWQSGLLTDGWWEMGLLHAGEWADDSLICPSALVWFVSFLPCSGPSSSK